MKNRNNSLLARVVALSLMTVSLCSAEPAKERADAKNPGFEVIRGLVGTWVSAAPAEGKKPMKLVYRLTAGGSAIVETMFPETVMEMVNVYTSDADGVLMTHFCNMGNQPRMRLKSAENGVLKFEFVDAGNLKSRNEPHMDSLEMTLKGDMMTQKWSMYQDGKVTGEHSFQFKRQ